MSDNPLILAVDDEPLNLEILQELLEKDYQIKIATTAEECFEKLETSKPDLILLDVNIPGSSGLEVCEKIKDDFETADIPVMFVSALGLPEDRMRGYKAGGEDYITKPFDEDELLVKIKLTLASQYAKEALQQSSNDAMSMAMTAMTQASEMGEVMQFTRDSYHCNSYEALANRLLESLSQFELSATLLITADKQNFFFSTSENIYDREKQVMEHVKDRDRFIHFGKRTIINFNNITVLIKNMPITDEEKYGRLNDVTGMLIEGADARIVGIEMAASLLKLIDTTQVVLNEIDTAHKQNEQKNIAIMDQLEERLEWSFINMDLSEQQEDYYREFLHHAKEQSKALYDADLQMEKKLEDLISSLSINPNQTG